MVKGRKEGVGERGGGGGGQEKKTGKRDLGGGRSRQDGGDLLGNTTDIREISLLTPPLCCSPITI